jgi:hypothetical protein
MVRKLVGDTYSDKIALSDTKPHPLATGSQPMSMIWIYTTTQNAKVGRKGHQEFELEATTYFNSAKALILANVDLGDMYVKASTAGAIIYILGTALSEGLIRNIVDIVK